MTESQSNYMKSYERKKKLISISRIIIFLLFIIIWELSSQLEIIDSFIFSSPLRVMKVFWSMCVSGTIFGHIGITILETFVSFLLIVVIGMGAAILLWLSTTFSKIIEPYLVILNSLPKSALAPLLIVWLGNNMRTIIVTAISIAVFATILNIYTSFVETDSEKIKLIKTLGGNKLTILFKLIIPASLPTLISIMKVNIGLSLVGVIIGEFLAARSGLGYLIIYSSQVFRLDIVIMSTVILCIIATLLYKSINVLEKIYKKTIN